MNEDVEKWTVTPGMNGSHPVLFVPCCLVLSLSCNLDTMSLGDTGNSAGGSGSGSDDTTSASHHEDETGPPSCPSDPCADGLALALDYDELRDGHYIATLMEDGLQRGAGRSQLLSCGFVVADGRVLPSQSPLCTAADTGSTASLSFPNYTAPSALITVWSDERESLLASTERTLSYETEPYGRDCGMECTRADVSVALRPNTPASPCSELLQGFTAAVFDVQSCQRASECGQPLRWNSGCTCPDAWVARHDADTTAVKQIVDQAQAEGCAWSALPATCDCEEATELACVDNVCRWQ